MVSARGVAAIGSAAVGGAFGGAFGGGFARPSNPAINQSEAEGMGVAAFDGVADVAACDLAAKASAASCSFTACGIALPGRPQASTGGAFFAGGGGSGG